MYSLNNCKQKPSQDSQMFTEGDPSTLLAVPKSLDQPLFYRVEGRAASGRGEEEWSPSALSPARPSHVLHAGNKQVLSREEESDEKDSCSKQKLRGKNLKKALRWGFSP